MDSHTERLRERNSKSFEMFLLVQAALIIRQGYCKLRACGPFITTLIKIYLNRHLKASRNDNLEKKLAKNLYYVKIVTIKSKLNTELKNNIQIWPAIKKVWQNIKVTCALINLQFLVFVIRI